MSSMRYLLCFACCWLSSSAGWARAQTQPGNPTLCELKLVGDAIKSVTLIKQGEAPRGAMDYLSGQKHQQPGKSLWLSPGRYRVEQVEIEGGLEAWQVYGEEEDWFEIESGKPCQLVVGAPLSPHVTVKRHGRYLEMDYELVDGAGRKYTQAYDDENPFAPPQFATPRFSVYKDGKLLGSEAFQYG